MDIYLDSLSLIAVTSMGIYANFETRLLTGMSKIGLTKEGKITIKDYF